MVPQSTFEAYDTEISRVGFVVFIMNLYETVGSAPSLFLGSLFFSTRWSQQEALETRMPSYKQGSLTEC